MCLFFHFPSLTVCARLDWLVRPAAMGEVDRGASVEGLVARGAEEGRASKDRADRLGLDSRFVVYER